MSTAAWVGVALAMFALGLLSRGSTALATPPAPSTPTCVCSVALTSPSPVVVAPPASPPLP